MMGQIGSNKWRGLVQDLPWYPQCLWHNGLGTVYRDPGGTQSWTTGPEAAPPILRPPGHGGKSKQTIQNILKCNHRVTQVYPLYPKLFNVVVDMVIMCWMKIVTEEAAGLEGFGWILKIMNSFLYANDGLLVSMKPGWLQWEFDIMKGLFERSGLNTNMWDTIGMVY